MPRSSKPRSSKPRASPLVSPWASAGRCSRWRAPARWAWQAPTSRRSTEPPASSAPAPPRAWRRSVPHGWRSPRGAASARSAASWSLLEQVRSAAVAQPEVEGDGAPLLAHSTVTQGLESPGAERGAGVFVEVFEAGRLLDQHVLLDRSVRTHDEHERHRALDSFALGPVRILRGDMAHDRPVRD